MVEKTKKNVKNMPNNIIREIGKSYLINRKNIGLKMKTKKERHLEKENNGLMMKI